MALSTPASDTRLSGPPRATARAAPRVAVRGTSRWQDAWRRLLRNKAAALIVTGGQYNVQAVAGSMLGFFAELGCQFPQFPYIAHSRGWSAEDMENNTRYVQESRALHDGARALADGTVEMAQLLVAGRITEMELVGGGRKGKQLDVRAQT